MIIFIGIFSLIIALNIVMALYRRASASLKEKISKANSTEVISMNLLSSKFKKAV